MLGAGEDRAFLCNATVAGNSSTGLQWERLSQEAPPLVTTSSGGNLSVADLTDNTVRALCQGMSGAYVLPLQSFLAPISDVPGSSIAVGPSGAVFLHLRAALLVCGADSSLSDRYSCFATNTSEEMEYKVGFILIIPSGVLPVVIGSVAGIVVFTLPVIAVIISLCWLRYRAKQKDPAPMNPEPFPLRRPSLLSPFFDNFNESPLEFSREKLHFICILGESPNRSCGSVVFHFYPAVVDPWFPPSPSPLPMV